MGNAHVAKISSSKTLLIGTAASIILSLFFLLTKKHLAGMSTSDETIQGMIGELIPYICIGNVSMTFGMICWSLVGAQGRYRLASIVAFLGSVFVTVPVGAAFS